MTPPDIFSPEFARDPYPFYRVMRDEHPLYLHPGANAYILSRYVAIAADNMGPGGARRIANAPQVFYPGRWTSKTGYDNKLDFDNGQEWVETERGSYLAWKSEIVSESAAMGRIEGVDWWTPELGAPARFSTNAGTPDGSRMLFVATLRESSVLPG
jgi:hypothetical protein